MWIMISVGWFWLLTLLAIRAEYNYKKMVQAGFMRRYIVHSICKGTGIRQNFENKSNQDEPWETTSTFFPPPCKMYSEEDTGAVSDWLEENTGSHGWWMWFPKSSCQRMINARNGSFSLAFRLCLLCVHLYLSPTFLVTSYTDGTERWQTDFKRPNPQNNECRKFHLEQFPSSLMYSMYMYRQYTLLLSQKKANVVNSKQ